MASGNQPGRRTGSNSFQGVNQEGDDAVFPAHGALDVACPGAFAPHCMEIRSFAEFRSDDSAGNGTKKITEQTAYDQKDFPGHAISPPSSFHAG